MKPSLVFLLAALLAAPPGVSAEAGGWTSAAGHFRVNYTPEPSPVPLNSIHSWIFHLEDAQGAPVEGAEITVEGGMPAHNHGLPTSPRQTAELGGGDYRVEGLRFHMMGEWEMRLRIDAQGQSDFLVIPLRL